MAALPWIFRNVSRYKEPENKIMPAIKKLAAHFNRASENFSIRKASPSNANA